MPDSKDDKCLDMVLANMREHGIDHEEVMWGEVRMIEDSDKQTVYIVKIDWGKLGRERGMTP